MVPEMTLAYGATLKRRRKVKGDWVQRTIGENEYPQVQSRGHGVGTDNASRVGARKN